MEQKTGARVSYPSAHTLAASPESYSRSASRAHAIMTLLPWPDIGELSAG
jgi:hypothetical protein